MCFTILRSYPMIGDFLAYQYAIDINYRNSLILVQALFRQPFQAQDPKMVYANVSLTTADYLRSTLLSVWQIAKIKNLSGCG